METGMHYRALNLNKLMESIRMGEQLLDEISAGIDYAHLPNRFEKVLGAYLANQSRQAKNLRMDSGQLSILDSMFRDHIEMIYLVDALSFDAITGEPEEDTFRERFNTTIGQRSLTRDNNLALSSSSHELLNPWYRAGVVFSHDQQLTAIRSALSRTVYRKLTELPLIDASSQDEPIVTAAEKLVAIFKGILLVLSLLTIPPDEWRYYKVRIRFAIEELEDRFLSAV